ncbi:sodium-dependent transporter [bacterium]|nr:sodium-dependent transporter [bacterium]
MYSRDHWKSKLGFILAAVGSAVGLGNIWKFPYVVGKNGGSAFIAIYLACVILVGIPILIVEIYLGKKSQLNPVGAFRFFQKGKVPFSLIGYAGVLCGIIILSYYSVITGWICHYLMLSFRGFSGSETEISEIFTALNANPWLNIAWHTFVMAAVMMILAKGVRKGIEAASKILMPMLGVLLLVLVCYSLTLDGMKEAWRFLTYPDFSRVTGSSFLEALGTSFFTLSLGMGAMITYGSYLKGEVNITKSAVQIASIDTLIAFLSGIVIFPIVFTNNLEPSAGPGLIFKTLPVLFSKMPGGHIVSIAFFALVLFAAITSAISLLEVATSFMVDEYKCSRTKAVLIMGTVIWLLGILSAVSYWNVAGTPFLDLFDKIASCYMLPLGGLCSALVFGWAISKKQKYSEIGSKPINKILLFAAKYISPVLLLLVFIKEIGLF